MEGACAAVRQVSAGCALTGTDTDTLNVEHELSRWLRDLDNSVSHSTSHICAASPLVSSTDIKQKIYTVQTTANRRELERRSCRCLPLAWTLLRSGTHYHK